MSKRITVACMALLLLLAALLLPGGRPAPRRIEHQHRTWPGESEVVTGLDEDGTLTSHLPLLILHTDGRTIPGQERGDDRVLLCPYSLICSPEGVNCSTDEPALTGQLAITIRGNSSREFPKKQYLLRLRDENGLPQKQSLLGMAPGTGWVLNGSFLDHSSIRNYMCYNLSAEIMAGYNPQNRFCEVLLTDDTGKARYEGLYNLIEKVRVSPERLDLEPADPRYPQTSFLMQINAYTDHIRLNHLKPDGMPAYPIDLEYPEAITATPAQLRYVEQQILHFEKALYDASFTGSWKAVEELIDLDSFVDYYLINEFFQNYDAGTRSTYLYQDLGRKIAIGPVWDFDGAFNNYAGTTLEIDELQLHYSLLYAYLIQDPQFTRLCAARYRELRQSFLSEDYLLSYIDDTAAYLGQAPLRNCDRWYGGNYNAYYQDLAAMKQFVVERGAWMDQHFDSIHLITAAGGH